MTIDFGAMSPSSWEAMVKELLCLEFPGTTPVAGDSGDEGIDAIEGLVDEAEGRIFQAKFFRTGVGETQRDQIRKSFKRAVALHSPKEWTLVIPVDLSIAELRWWESFRERNETKHSLRISLLSRTHISTLLAKHRPVKQSYFDSTSDMLSVLVAETKGLGYEKDAALKIVGQALEVLNRDEDRWCIALEADEQTVRIILGARDETRPPTITIRFLPTPEGRQAASDFRTAIETGADWCAEGKAVELDGLPHIGEQLSEISFSHNLPDLRLLIRLATWKDGYEVAASSPLQLFLRRRGMAEAEFSTSENDGPLSVSLVIQRAGVVTLHLNKLRWSGYSAASLLRTYRLVDSLKAGAELLIEDLQRESTLGRARIEDDYVVDDLSVPLRFFEALDQIESATGTRFDIGERFTQKDWSNALEIASLLGGQGRSLTEASNVTVSLDRELDQSMVEGSTISIAGGQLGRSAVVLGKTFYTYSTDPTAVLKVSRAQRVGVDSAGNPQYKVEGEWLNPPTVDGVKYEPSEPDGCGQQT